MERQLGVSASSVSSIVKASVWMVVISLALFFLPVINGLVAGIVGGYKAGNTRNGLLAAILPAGVLALGLWLLLAVFGLPVIGAFAGLALGIWILVSDLGLFVGALIGGAARSR